MKEFGSAIKQTLGLLLPDQIYCSHNSWCWLKVTQGPADQFIRSSCLQCQVTSVHNNDSSSDQVSYVFLLPYKTIINFDSCTLRCTNAVTWPQLFYTPLALQQLSVTAHVPFHGCGNWGYDNWEQMAKKPTRIKKKKRWCCLFSLVSCFPAFLVLSVCYLFYHFFLYDAVAFPGLFKPSTLTYNSSSGSE